MFCFVLQLFYFLSFQNVLVYCRFKPNPFVLNCGTKDRLTKSGPAGRVTRSSEEERDVFQIELFHEQLPLPVPCYDLLPVTELTVDRREAGFGYSRLP